MIDKDKQDMIIFNKLFGASLDSTKIIFYPVQVCFNSGKNPTKKNRTSLFTFLHKD
jgi:hypothetical protein